jgi:hypothetical protein
MINFALRNTSLAYLTPSDLNSMNLDDNIASAAKDSEIVAMNSADEGKTKYRYLSSTLW